MKIQLSDHFTTGKLLRFVAPSIVMMIFTSVYGVVDGLFVSNFVGKTAFAAVNLIFPLLMILGALGFMIGTGGSALVARTLGEGDSGRAQRYFSMLVYVTIGGGIVFSVLGLLFLRPIAVLLGAQGAMLEDCVVYGGILAGGPDDVMLQNVFQSFLITAEKPHFGLGVTVAAGLIQYHTGLFCSSPCSAGAWRGAALPRPPASLWAAAYRCCILPGPTAAFCGLEKRSWTAVHC